MYMLPRAKLHAEEVPMPTPRLSSASTMASSSARFGCSSSGRGAQPEELAERMTDIENFVRRQGQSIETLMLSLDQMQGQQDYHANTLKALIKDEKPARFRSDGEDDEAMVLYALTEEVHILREFRRSIDQQPNTVIMAADIGILKKQVAQLSDAVESHWSTGTEKSGLTSEEVKVLIERVASPKDEVGNLQRKLAQLSDSVKLLLQHLEYETKLTSDEIKAMKELVPEPKEEARILQRQFTQLSDAVEPERHTIKSETRLPSNEIQTMNQRVVQTREGCQEACILQSKVIHVSNAAESQWHKIKLVAGPPSHEIPSIREHVSGPSEDCQAEVDFGEIFLMARVQSLPGKRLEGYHDENHIGTVTSLRGRQAEKDMVQITWDLTKKTSQIQKAAFFEWFKVVGKSDACSFQTCGPRSHDHLANLADEAVRKRFEYFVTSASPQQLAF